MQELLPGDETDRLAALRSYNILDTPAEEAFDDLAALAACVCQTPIALVSLVATARQWFKAKIGLSVCETPRELAFCAHAIRQPTDLFVVPDATADPRFATNPLVTHDPKIRFYAGAPLVTPDGYALGTLCVIDFVPRVLTPEQESALRILARQVMAQLELRCKTRDLELLVTEQKRKEEELRASEERLRLAMDAAQLGYWELDAQTNCNTIGGHYEKIFGLCPGTFGGTFADFLSLVHPADRDRIQHEAQRNHKSATPLNIEYRTIQADGSIGWAVSYGYTHHDPHTGATIIRGVIRDISERKHAEQALRDSEERYASVFRHAQDGIFVVSVRADGSFVYESFNPALEAVLGLSSAAMSGKSPEECFPAAVATYVGERYRTCVAMGQPIAYDEEAQLPVGTRSAHTLLVPIRDTNGRIFRLVGISRDFTERRRVEEQLRVALKEKEILLKEIHHRVKNNLQVISSLLSLQSSALKEPQLLHVFRESQQRVRAMALIHEKLYQSHDFAKVDFAEYVRSLVSHLFRVYAAPGGVALQTRVEDVFLRVDTALPCGLILNELVSNALKYAFPGGRAGTLQIELHADLRGQVQLQVKDDGIGFPPGLDFRETDSLGLQLVNTLIEQLHGTIELQSGAGSTFLLTFPL